MKTVLQLVTKYLLIASLFSFSAKAQDSLASIPSPEYYIITMEDGTVLCGNIIHKTLREISVEDFTAGKIFVPVKRIISREKIDSSTVFIVMKKDGSAFRGKFISRRAQEVDLLTELTGKVTVQLKEIRELKRAETGTSVKKGQFWFKSPAHYEYFATPSAIGIRKGEIYYHNSMLISHSVQAGITDHVSLGGGIFLLGVYLNPRATFKINSNLYGGAGLYYFQTFIDNKYEGFNAAVSYGQLTWGTHDFQITGGIGMDVFNTNSGTAFSQQPIFTASGLVRIGRKFALVTDNWIAPIRRSRRLYGSPLQNLPVEYLNFISWGCRLLRERYALGFGFIQYKDFEKYTAVGIPYIDCIIKF